MPTAPTNRIRNELPEGSSQPDWKQQFEHCQSAITDTVRENPLGSTLAVFGIGLGVGALIGSLLANPAEQRRQHLASSIGRKMLDSMQDFVPDSIQQHLRS